jgi:hypothetical protein
MRQAWRDLLGLCRREGIPTALVVMPEGPVFRSWYPPRTWALVREFLDDLGREYRVGVIDARDWMAEEDFIDSHHLLPQAAELFSARLGHEALAPLLASRLAPGGSP